MLTLNRHEYIIKWTMTSKFTKGQKANIMRRHKGHSSHIRPHKGHSSHIRPLLWQNHSAHFDVNFYEI